MIRPLCLPFYFTFYVGYKSFYFILAKKYHPSLYYSKVFRNQYSGFPTPLQLPSNVYLKRCSTPYLFSPTGLDRCLFVCQREIEKSKYTALQIEKIELKFISIQAKKRALLSIHQKNIHTHTHMSTTNI